MNSERILSEEQVEQFNRDGFILVRGMYSPEETKAISDWTDEVVSWPEVAGKDMKYFEENRVDGSRILCRVENFVPYHE